jgi:tetratricopeptide (TPR) repeat protein
MTESTSPLLYLDEDLWRLRATCTACDTSSWHQIRTIWVDTRHAAISFDEALLVAPSPVCPACGATDAYRFPREDELALTAIIKAMVDEQTDAPLPFNLQSGPVALATPDGSPPVIIRRASHGIAELARRAALTPTDPEGWLRLALLASGYHDLDEAAAALDNALRLNPSHEVASQRLVSTLRELDDPTIARRALERSISLLADPRLDPARRGIFSELFTDMIRLHATHEQALHLQLGQPHPIDDAIAVKELRDWTMLAQLLAIPTLTHVALTALPDDLPQHGLYMLLHEAPGTSHTIVRAAPKVGRNDLCPCGSGKKYKKCHGAAN